MTDGGGGVINPGGAVLEGATIVRGREREIARIQDLIDAAQAGRSGALAIVGETGIGKSSLLDAAAERAEGMLVMRARGVESEAELPFSGLHELFQGVVPSAALPPALRDALAGRPSDALDRFSVFVGTLEALAAAAAARPTLALVDDAQWLDTASFDAIRFVCRRLGHEGVVLIVAGRLDAAAFERAGLPVLTLGGLDAAAGARVIEDVTGLEAAPSVVEALLAGTGGNPLALRRTASELDPGQLAGVLPLPDPSPAAGELFAGAIAALPEPTRRALLMAAAAGADARAEVLRPALEAEGLSLSDLEVAERAGLIRVGPNGIRFSHPLVRAAAYHAEAPAARRRAHEVLADRAPPDELGEARAWHRAAAVVGLDAGAADALDAVAVAQRARGGHAAASRAFARAAGLSKDSSERGRRLLDAASSARLAGAAGTALALADQALTLSCSPQVRAGLHGVRAAVDLAGGRLAAARGTLIDEAARLEVFDRSAAAAMLTEGALPGLWAGDVFAAVVPARAAYALARAAGTTARMEQATTVAQVALGRHLEARPALARWLDRARREEPLADVAGTLALSRVLIWREQWDEARLLLEGLTGSSRRRAPGELPLALEALAELDWRTGRWSSGQALAAEGVELADQMDHQLGLIRCLAVLARYHAVMGNDGDCRAALVRLAGLLASLAGETWIEGLSEGPAGLLALAHGDGVTAADLLGSCVDAADARGVRDPGALAHLADAVEAELLAGRREAASRRLATLLRRAEEGGQVVTEAAAERCRALLDDGPSWEPRLLRSAALLEGTPAAFERARSLLALGERMRRDRRRAEAREPLRAALSLFDALGAAPWSRRARSELRATGERVAGRRGAPTTELTAQELRVAVAVAEGVSNREAGAALFLSPRTVEHHLTRVYEKLGVRSRAALARRLLGDRGTAPPGESSTPIGPGEG
jgi:DNA-binding CsgD family transcriptional regulator